MERHPVSKDTNKQTNRPSRPGPPTPLAWVVLWVGAARGSSGPELPASSFSLVSGGSGVEEASEEALGHGCEPSAEPWGLQGPLPEALGGGGLLGGADVLWTDALLLCSAPSLEARARRTTSPEGGCSFPV